MVKKERQIKDFISAKGEITFEPDGIVFEDDKGRDKVTFEELKNAFEGFECAFKMEMTSKSEVE